MKTFELIKKDFLEFTREKRTFAMLIAVPIVILVILGFVFGGGTSGSNAKIAFCNYDSGIVGSELFSQMSSKVKTEDITQNYAAGDSAACQSGAEAEVASGTFSAAIILPADFSQGIENGIGQKVTVILDNSKGQVSASIESQLRALLQQFNEEIGKNFVSAVWTDLGDAADKLAKLEADVNTTSTKAIQLRERLLETQASLNSINFSKAESLISDAERLALESNASIIDAKEKANITLQKLDNFQKELNASLEQMIFIRDQVSAADALLAGPLLVCGNSTFNPLCAPVVSFNATFSDVKLKLDQRIEGMKTALADVAEMRGYISDLLFKTRDSAASLDEAISKIGSAKDFVAQLKTMEKQAFDSIAEANATLELLVEKGVEFSAVMKDSKSQLLALTSRSPQDVVTPISLSVQNEFAGAQSNYSFLVPGLIANLVMFLAMFLSSTAFVREKLQKTLQRSIAAQKTRLEFVVKKTFSLSVVLFIPSIVMILTGIIGYGAFQINWLLLPLLLALYLETLVFCALGIAIATQSESETTAFLLSLVCCLPLLFTSGVLFSLEFMPSWIATISYALPLGQAIVAVNSTSIYGGIAVSAFAWLIAYAVALVALAWILIEREKDL